MPDSVHEQPTNAANDPVASDAASPKRGGLGKRFWKTARWETGSSFVFMGLRPATGIFVAWFLDPIAFGMMLVVNTVNSVLQMFTDTGIEQAIIQSPRGDDPVYLDTAYTVQAVRGLLLYLAACAVGVLVAWWRDEWLIAVLMAVTSTNVIALSLRPTRCYQAYRDLDIGQFTRLRIYGQLTGPLGAILLVFTPLVAITHGVWVLVYRGAFPRFAQLALYFFFLPGRKSRFGFDRTSFLEIFSFGKWVFGSTLVSAISQYADVFILAAFLDTTTLGYYAVARVLGEFVPKMMMKLNIRAVYPALSDTIRNRPERFNQRLAKARLVAIGLTTVIALLLIVAAPWIVSVLLPQRYADVGWMLQFIVLQPVGLVMSAGYQQAMLAMGRSDHGFYTRLVQSFARIVMMAAGGLIGSYYGAVVFGVLFAMVAQSFVFYLVGVPFFRRMGLWQPKLDLPVMGGLLAMVLLCFQFGVLPWNPPLINPPPPEDQAPVPAAVGARVGQIQVDETPGNTTPESRIDTDSGPSLPLN